MYRSFSRCLLIFGFLLGGVPLTAQVVRTVPPLRVLPDLGQMTRRAGLIFTGTVTSITPIHATGSDTVESVQITFQVEQAVRGPRAGRTFTIREWTGLWTSGQRYRVGERLMLFLYPPSKVGLTSPVGGAAGRFAVNGNGQVLLSPLQVEVLKAAPARIPMDYKHRVAIRGFTSAVRRMAEE